MATLDVVFPTVFWGELQATFLPEGQPLPAGAAIPAALVFALDAGRFVLADILGRGWSIPGGHLLPGETPEAAVRRETLEEIGATLKPLTRLGHYLLTSPPGEETLIPTYVAEVAAFVAPPTGPESQGICRLALDELPTRYYRWDALLKATFAYALAQARSS